LAACPSGLFGFNGKGACLVDTACPEGFYAHETTHACVSKAKCTEELKGFIYKKKCIQDCASTDQPFSHLGRCTKLCPETYYGYNNKGPCIKECPKDYFGEAISRLCKSLQQCNALGMFVYEKLCIKDCSVPTNPAKPFSSKGVCVTQCPD
jgi:hypothetical protein